MTNAIMRNLTMFRNLCGDDAFQNVTLVTTFWDEMNDTAKGERREKQLVEERKWWGYMASKGSRIRRFMNTRQTAIDIVTELAGLPCVTLQVQKEMVDEGLDVNKTTAAEALNKELAELAAKHSEELKRLQKDMERAIKDHDEELQQTIRDMQQEKRALIRRLENEQEALQADRREEIRQLEQKFNDHLHRLERERKEREAEIDDLESRLARERLDADSKLQEALTRSSNTISQLKNEMEHARGEDKRRYERTLRELEQQQQKSVAESRRWQNEVANANTKIMELTMQHAFARDDERERLEGRIRELETSKSESSTSFWDVLVPLTAIALQVLL
jgi:DNA repair exonuclease SbcCD ATPase subunit